jgi:peptidoglycan hydrolase-like protein with peptidoglycan-binding domain
MAKFFSNTLQKGSKGNEVSEWQKFLNSQGYDLSVDGDFGDNTPAATTEWQRKNGLDADGIVGENTWGKAGYAPKVNYNSSQTSAPNVGNAPSKPTFNTNATATPNVGKAPTAPTFNTTATATPESKPLPNAPTYDSTSWDDTEKGQAALGGYNSAKDAVNNYGDFTYEDYTEGDKVTAAGDALNSHLANKPGAYQSQWQSQLDALMNSIMNRDKFSYNMNEDALYQQYKDKYIEQGKMAMADTMGQAAAMTGGYGNSYAQSVGQQAYQGQLDNLNDIVPELYAMALDKYNREGQELYNQYGMVMDRENTDYGRYRDSVSDWMTDRGYLTDRYDTERGFDYGKYVDDRNLDHALHQEGYQKLLDSLGIAQSDYYDGANMFHSEQATKNSVEGQIFNDAMSLWGAENDEAWKKYQASEDQRQYANSLLQQGYQNEFGAWEANSNNAWKQYQANEEARQYANSLLQQGYQNEFGEWEANSDNAWKQVQWDEAARQYANEEAWRQKEWDENNRRYEESKVTTSTPTTKPTTQPTKQPEKEPEKEPEAVQPTSTANTTSFINSHMTSSEFMQRGGTSKTPSLRGGGGRTYAEYKQYIAAELEKNWGNMTDAEKAYLIEYYKL